MKAAELLAFEARGWLTQGAKERAVRDELGLTPTRYYQHLVRAMRDPVAIAEHPAVAARLRRQAERKSYLRAG